jgi:hypothetical protein
MPEVVGIQEPITDKVALQRHIIGSTPDEVTDADDDADVDDGADVGADGADVGAPAAAISGSLRARLKGPVPQTALKGGSTLVGTTSSVVGHVGQAGMVLGHVSTATGTALSTAGTALSVAAPILGPVGIALSGIDLIKNGVSAAKTYSHLSALDRILRDYWGKPGVLPGTVEAIAFTMQKKNVKLKRKGIGCVPVVGATGVTCVTLCRRIQKKRKGIRGAERRSHAKTLWKNMLQRDPLAVAACKELLGAADFEKLRRFGDGDRVLKNKMRSL